MTTDALGNTEGFLAGGEMAEQVGGLFSCVELVPVGKEFCKEAVPAGVSPRRMGTLQITESWQSGKGVSGSSSRSCAGGDGPALWHSRGFASEHTCRVLRQTEAGEERGGATEVGDGEERRKP